MQILGGNFVALQSALPIGAERFVSVVFMLCVCVFVCFFLSLFLSFFVCLFACLFAYLFVCLLICLFVCLFACLLPSFLPCLFVYVSVCVCVCPRLFSLPIGTERRQVGLVSFEAPFVYPPLSSSLSWLKFLLSTLPVGAERRQVGLVAREGQGGDRNLVQREAVDLGAKGEVMLYMRSLLGWLRLGWLKIA